MLSDCDDEDWHPTSEEAEVEVNVNDDDAKSFSSVTNSPPEVATESDEAEPVIVDKFKPRSSIWQFFKVYKDKALDKYAHCTICNQKVLYTSHHSTGMLDKHFRTKHRERHEENAEAMAEKRLKMSSGSVSVSTSEQSKITGFLNYCDKFPHAYLKWAVMTYQPIRACEHPSFREMCHSLNGKAPLFGRDKVQKLLSEECAVLKVKMRNILHGKYFCSTTDAWTSRANVSYITNTVHFVDPKSWLLHSFVLGIFQKDGRSTAPDVVKYVENGWNKFDLPYSKMICIVTDTKATMVKAGRLFKTRSRACDGETQWHGCVDHILELVTKKAFVDLPQSAGAMSAARSLVGHFSSSPQAEAKLLSKQVQTRAVKCIQDVATRWWSTYSMCERLLRLRPYFSLMEAEGELDCNLTEEQWAIIKDTCDLLEPFMCAQKTLEGQKYVTISLVPLIIYSVRTGLIEKVEDVDNTSLQVRSLARVMLDCFNQHWGEGLPGTVAREHLTEGPNRRPKGIPLLTLVASILDPRTMFGPGLTEEDKRQVTQVIYNRLLILANEEDVARREENIELEENAAEGNVAERQLQQQRQQQQQQQQQQQINPCFAMLEQFRRSHIQRANQQHITNRGAVTTSAEARARSELSLYLREPILPMTHEDGTFTNPLDWWRVNATRFPLVAKLAMQILAIPATSAPAERVFSLAGITIANDRARLLPENANELLFLREALVSVRKYEECVLAYN